MCGIAGKINWEGAVSEEIVVKMRDRMTHRGPDDYGITNLNNAVLGHRRLSIIDLSKQAAQPMCSPDKRYWIVYNGEVYNFRDIRKELEKEGFVFRSHSDTEVVLSSYICWGRGCLSKFNGMFVLAIWDAAKKELFLARDRFGKKPLYCWREGSRFSFASELEALLCDKDIPRKISYEALNCYLALGYILSPMTLYKDIFRLECASYMLLTDSGRRVQSGRYWDYALHFRKKTGFSEVDIAENVLGLLDKAVRRRMVSDVPLGAFLSGGIDSSSVAALMKKYHQGDLHTFSIGFPQKSYNELRDADRAAKWIGSVHHNRVSQGGGELINEALAAYDEPFSDSSFIPTYELSKLTSSYVKVALSGDGADEIFAGYITYMADRLRLKTDFIPQPLKKVLARVSASTKIGNGKKLPWFYKQKQFFRGALYPPEKAHYCWRLIFDEEERIAILGEGYRDLVYASDPFLTFKKYYDATRDLHWLDRHLYVDAMTWLTDDILVKVDRAAMKNSLEVRSPYLDVELAEFTASIPAELKVNGLKTKYILKKSLKNTLPSFIINKKKSGFNAPVGAWLGYRGLDEFKAFNRFIFDRFAKGLN